jgi:hypothetical protein
VVAGLLLQCTIRPGMTETGPSGKDGKLEMMAGGITAGRGTALRSWPVRGRVFHDCLRRLSLYVVPTPTYAGGVKSVSFDVDY